VTQSALAAAITSAGQPAGTPSATADRRLAPAAHEFEACLMKEFLEPLQKDALFSEKGEDEGEGSSNALMSFGSEALARAISERGGFGIAAKIIEHFKVGGTQPKTGSE
jgi:peptidoglycan hydrolase FlgJ